MRPCEAGRVPVGITAETEGPLPTALLPRRIDNTFRGRKLALWLFGLLVFMKSALALNSIFNGRSVATSADGIPLDTFGPDGAQAVVSLFAIWGLGHLTLCAVALLALVRYRAMVPLLFAVFLLEHLARRLILTLMPIVRTPGAPAPAINLLLLGLMVVGLVLSLYTRADVPEESTA